MKRKKLFHPTFSLGLLAALLGSLVSPSVAFASTGTISGTVYAADGVTPLANVFVALNTPTESGQTGCTDASGNYEFSNVDFDVTYIVEAAPVWGTNCGSAVYVPEYWPEKIDSGSATPVTVSASNPVHTGLDFTLDPGGVISGTVYAADGITPLEHIGVSFQSDYHFPSESVCSDANGQYIARGVPLNVPVRLRANTWHDPWCNATGDYVQEYRQETLQDGPVHITLTAADPQQTGADFLLDPEGSRRVPNLGVWYQEGWIEAFDWPMGTHLKLKIEDITTPVSPDYSQEMDVTETVPEDPATTRAIFDLEGGFEMAPGMIVSVSGDYLSAYLLIDALTITNVDPDLDVISGSTAPNNWLWMFSPQSCCRSTVANGSGVWSMDFSQPGPEGQPIADIGPGSFGAIHAPSGDGRTSVAWSIPNMTLQFDPSTADLGVGNTTTVQIELNGANGLYGYQFQVNYDPSKVSATGAFVNSFFDTSGAIIPGGWNAQCADGVCKFAVSRVNPAPAVNGSGPLAQITFTGVGSGAASLSITNEVMSNRSGESIPTDIAGTATLSVYGFATVSGVVNLQGRASPGDTAGTVTLTDTSGQFAPVTVTVAANGTWTANNIPALPAGSTYRLDAAHPLYLATQRLGVVLQPDHTYVQPLTRLKGGDANNDGTISIGDLSCIGGTFGGAPGTCGGLGSSDINADGLVNILDLVLAGGNYGLSAPLTW